jgi:hypothetical protein
MLWRGISHKFSQVNAQIYLLDKIHYINDCRESSERRFTSSHKFNEVIDFAYVNALSVNLKYRFFHSMKNTPLEFFFWSHPCLIDIASKLGRKTQKKPKKTGSPGHEHRTETYEVPAAPVKS